MNIDTRKEGIFLLWVHIVCHKYKLYKVERKV